MQKPEYGAITTPSKDENKVLVLIQRGYTIFLKKESRRSDGHCENS
jgi:hypothetical protein